MPASDFYRPDHAALWTAILGLDGRGEPVDPVSVGEALRAILGEAKAPADVESLRFYAPSSPDKLEHFAKIITGAAMVRRIDDAIARVRAKLTDQTASPDEISAYAMMAIGGAAVQTATRTPMMLVDVMEKWWASVEARHGSTRIGISTRLKSLDEIIGGYQPGKLYLVAARPGMSKTVFAMLGPRACAEAGTTALFTSIEMPDEELAGRLICETADVNSDDVRDGTLAKELQGKLWEATQELSALPILIDDAPVTTVQEIRSIAIRVKAQRGLGMLVVDYLQLLSNDDTSDRRRDEQVAAMTRGLKQLSRELKIPVLVVSQLNRDCEKRPDKRPMLSDLRESGAIEQDADVVMFLYREEYYDKETLDKGIAEVIVAKQRGGRLATVPVSFEPTRTRFRDLTEEDVAAWRERKAPTVNAPSLDEFRKKRR